MKHYVYNAPFKMVDKDGNKYTLRVEQDDMAYSPRDWDNVSTMICWHRHYNLGDKHDYDDSFEFLLGVAREVGIYTDEMEDMSNEEIMTELRKDDSVCIIPLNLYDHSGISISTSNGYPYNDRWDAGCVGYAYITKKKAMEELYVTDETWRARARERIDAEVEDYDKYLRGDVYGYILEKEVVVEEKCPCCGKVIKTYTEMEEVDSCWGYYGTCLEENGIGDECSNLEFVD